MSSPRRPRVICPRRSESAAGPVIKFIGDNKTNASMSIHAKIIQAVGCVPCAMRASLARDRSKVLRLCVYIQRVFARGLDGHRSPARVMPKMLAALWQRMVIARNAKELRVLSLHTDGERERLLQLY